MKLTLSQKSRWPLAALVCGVLAASADVASAQNYCANSLDPMCGVVRSGQAQLRPAQPRSVRPQYPPRTPNPGISNLPTRIGGELTSPVTDGIARKYPGAGRVGKGVSGVNTVLDPSPGDVFCVALPPGPQKLACEGFVEASWPETISRRQGIYTPDDLGAEGRRIQRAQDSCFPSDRMWGEGRGVRGRPCKQPGEFTDDERASVEQANRDAVSHRQRALDEAERQRQSWNAPRERADFLQDVVNRTRQILNDAGLSPEDRAEVERQMNDHLRQLNRSIDRGIPPTPPSPAVAPVPPYRVPPPTRSGSTGSKPDPQPRYYYDGRVSGCTASEGQSCGSR